MFSGMDSVLNVEKEIDKVLTKFTGLQEHSEQSLNELILQLQNLQRDLSVLTSNQCELSGIQIVIMNQNIKKIRDIITQIATEHRELHGTVSKVGKTIDKNFISDFVALGNEGLLDEPESRKLVNQVIVEHFLREGMMDIGEELIKESGIIINESKKEPFVALNQILNALKKGDLKPALEWAKANRTALMGKHSFLEFKLHRLQFIELIRGVIDSNGMSDLKQNAIIKYARENFQIFATRHEKEIQSLMGCLLYLRTGLQNSPYAHLMDPINWSHVCDLFTRDACSLLGLSLESPLSVTFNAGCQALPSLLNLKQVMSCRQVSGVWSTKDELPIEIDLGRETHFHSIFACPILRQQSDDRNPPMRLVCGHVVSRDALHKLANSNKLKCPYCPIEQNPSDARQINF